MDTFEDTNVWRSQHEQCCCRENGYHLHLEGGKYVIGRGVSQMHNVAFDIKCTSSLESLTWLIQQ